MNIKEQKALALDSRIISVRKDCIKPQGERSSFFVLDTNKLLIDLQKELIRLRKKAGEA